MARSRKTISVEFLLEYANSQLERQDSDATMDFKSGVCAMIERVLHSTDNYNGFRFLDNSDSEINTLGHVTRRYYKPNHS